MRRFRPAASPLVLFLCCLYAINGYTQGNASQSSSTSTAKTPNAEAQKAQPDAAAHLEQQFFAIVRSADVKRFLSYVPEGGVNVGSSLQHLTRSQVEDQLTDKRGLYCKLFDSGCIPSEIELDKSNVRACSYRELLTKSQKVRTAATETTRNGVRQAILVAEVKNDNCSGVGLIDFIFNLHADGWKLFSIP